MTESMKMILHAGVKRMTESVKMIHIGVYNGDDRIRDNNA